jgi:hypothetical protein
MPAIHPARLRQQTASLGESFLSPDLFLRRLHDLLDFYADRTLRPGQGGQRPSRLPHYSAPKPVLRQVMCELDICTANAGWPAALVLADRLWSNGYFETRLIAIHLIGQAGTPPEQVAARVISWAHPGDDPDILEALLGTAQISLQETRTDVWFDLVKNWTSADEVPVQEMGLRALRSMLVKPGFENLPAVFAILASVLRTASAALHFELAAVLEACARHSPGETLYFIRQTVAASPEPHMARLIRRCLPFFDDDGQKSLRQLLVARKRGGAQESMGHWESP